MVVLLKARLEVNCLIAVSRVERQDLNNLEDIGHYFSSSCVESLGIICGQNVVMPSLSKVNMEARHGHDVDFGVGPSRVSGMPRDESQTTSSLRYCPTFLHARPSHMSVFQAIS